MRFSRPFFPSENFLYFFATLMSLSLSIFITSNQWVINPDAICYVMSAKSIEQAGVRGAMHFCAQAAWPFYSIVIYAVVLLTDFSYVMAAQVIDAFFSSVSVIMFILIVKELGGNLRTLWFAALTILLAHEFNNVREYIVRDHGFWAFYLFSIWSLLYYFRKPSWLMGVLWNLSIFMAALFRIEGAVFLLLLPFLSFFYIYATWPERFRLWIRLTGLSFLMIVCLLIWLVLHPHHALEQFGRGSDLIEQLRHGLLMITVQYQQTSQKLSSYIFTMHSHIHPGVLFLILLIGAYFVYLAANLSWVYSLLVLYAIKRQVVYFSFSGRLVLTGYLLVNLIITLVFLAEHLFLSNRYLIAFSLVFMIWVAFVLDYIYQRKHVFAYQLGLGVIVCLMCLSSLGGIFEFGYSKAYLYQASNWIARHVPPNASLYSNDIQVRYYSKQDGKSVFAKQALSLEDDLITNQKWKQYDYLALRLNKKIVSHFLSFLLDPSLQPIAEFANQRGDKVIIFQVRKQIS